jgi:hypothetical protein
LKTLVIGKPEPASEPEPEPGLRVIGEEQVIGNR